MDSSIWIDFLSASPGPAGNELRRLVVEAESVALTGLVLTEVLQGLRRDVERIEHYLSMFEILEPHGIDTYRTAASLFRLARSRGIGLTTVDAVIAAIALEHRASVFSLDKDFARLSDLTGLTLHATP